jgi:hypothetical protein
VTYFNPESWRPFSRAELRLFVEERGSARARRGSRSRNRSLVLQGSLSPFDVYTYLHSRFGKPNGIQTMLAADDSDNLFHWDWNLKAGLHDLSFIGATQEVHVKFGRSMSDAACRRFISALKADFARVATEKGRFAGTLEKWRIFPNRFLTLANRCGELFATLERTVPRLERMLDGANDRDLIAQGSAKRASRLMGDLMTVPTELSVLTPVMFESFLGLIVALLIKPEIRTDQAAFQSFVRSPLNIKLTSLADRCRGFVRSLDQADPVFGRYWQVVNRRNDIIHGNVDPMRDVLEVVYFDGKRPLYTAGGDRIRQHWSGLMRQYRPSEVMEDYVATHEFILDILDHLHPVTRDLVDRLIRDTQPAWDDRRKMFGVLFPDAVATVLFDGLRYDWEL